MGNRLVRSLRPCRDRSIDVKSKQIKGEIVQKQRDFYYAVSFFLAHSAIQRAVFHNFGFGVEHLSCQSSKVVGEGDEKVR